MQDYVKFKDFSRTTRCAPTVFKDNSVIQLNRHTNEKTNTKFK